MAKRVQGLFQHIKLFRHALAVLKTGRDVNQETNDAI